MQSLTLYESGRKMIEDEEAYDIIFLDIEMPEINGIETAEALRKWDVRSKIIYLTNYSNFKSHAYKVHAFDYLCKPIKEEEIYAVLNEAVRYLEEAEVSPEIFLRQARAASILESMRSITLNIVQENYRSYVKEGVIRRHLIA